MQLRVLLFASYADAFGASAVSVPLREGASVRDLLAEVERMAAGRSLPPAPLVALNHSYAAPGDVISAGDEVALIPPVAGG